MLKRFLLVCFLSFTTALPASALSILPLPLDRIVDSATLAFQGKCLSNRTERDPQTGLIVTYTTFQIQDALKGSLSDTHTIKQIGGQLAGADDSTLVKQIEGVPRFEPGESYVLFLNGISSAGFSSPVGLGQGTFKLLQGAQGQQVTNGRDFREMTAGQPRQLWSQSVQSQFDQPAGRLDMMDLDEFKAYVRKKTGGAK